MRRARGSAPRSRAAAVVLTSVVVVGLAGCSMFDGRGTDDAQPSSPSGIPSSTPSAAPSTPPSSEGEARPPSDAEALARFDASNRAVIAGVASPTATAFVDSLVEAGFDPASIEVTSDTTTLGERADSIQFAVRIDDRCLIGQYGAGSDGYRSTEAGVLGTGGCLVGAAVAVGG